jgi:hypothetical protein
MAVHWALVKVLHYIGNMEQFAMLSKTTKAKFVCMTYEPLDKTCPSTTLFNSVHCVKSTGTVGISAMAWYKVYLGCYTGQLL